MGPSSLFLSQTSFTSKSENLIQFHPRNVWDRLYYSSNLINFLFFSFIFSLQSHRHHPDHEVNNRPFSPSCSTPVTKLSKGRDVRAGNSTYVLVNCLGGMELLYVVTIRWICMSEWRWSTWDPKLIFWFHAIRFGMCVPFPYMFGMSCPPLWSNTVGTQNLVQLPLPMPCTLNWISNLIIYVPNYLSLRWFIIYHIISFIYHASL